MKCAAQLADLCNYISYEHYFSFELELHFNVDLFFKETILVKNEQLYLIIQTRQDGLVVKRSLISYLYLTWVNTGTALSQRPKKAY